MFLVTGRLGIWSQTGLISTPVSVIASAAPIRANSHIKAHATSENYVVKCMHPSATEKHKICIPQITVSNRSTIGPTQPTMSWRTITIIDGCRTSPRACLMHHPICCVNSPWQIHGHGPLGVWLGILRCKLLARIKFWSNALLAQNRRLVYETYQPAFYSN